MRNGGKGDQIYIYIDYILYIFNIRLYIRKSYFFNKKIFLFRNRKSHY